MGTAIVVSVNQQHAAAGLTHNSSLASASASASARRDTDCLDQPPDGCSVSSWGEFRLSEACCQAALLVLQSPLQGEKSLVYGYCNKGGEMR